jgi:hypothetical protein
LPRNFRIRADVQCNGRFAGIAVRCKERYSEGWALQFDMVRGTVQVKRADAGYFNNNEKHLIHMGLNGSNEWKFTLDLIVYDTIMDVEIDGCRTLTARIDDREGAAVFAYAHCGRAAFENVRVDKL